MSGIYEQLNPRHMHLYTGYMDTFLTDKQKITNPMEGVTITNNGLCQNPVPDEEFRFDNGQPIIIGTAGEDDKGWLQKAVCINNPGTSTRDISITTGVEGMRLLYDALRQEATRQSGILPIIDTGLIDELVNYRPPTRRFSNRVENEGIWHQITREFETEQEAIAYLDSLSQEITEDE